MAADSVAILSSEKNLATATLTNSCVPSQAGPTHSWDACESEGEAVLEAFVDRVVAEWEPEDV